MPSESEEEYRAILTEREREILSREADVSDGYYYRVVSRARKKIEQLGIDLDLLDDHHPKLAAELRDTVCDSLPDSDGSDGSS